MQQHVMSFEVGGVLEDSQWQAPAHCFNGDNASTAATNVAGPGDRVDSEDVKVDIMMNSLIRFAGTPAITASF